MTAYGVPEQDWKVFRELREVALERLCERALGDAMAVIEKRDESHHKRFLELFDLLVDRNQDIARGFDAPRRSAMLAQLSFIHSLELLESDELARLSASTLEAIESRAKLL